MDSDGDSFLVRIASLPTRLMQHSKNTAFYGLINVNLITTCPYRCVLTGMSEAFVYMANASSPMAAELLKIFRNMNHVLNGKHKHVSINCYSVNNKILPW